MNASKRKRIICREGAIVFSTNKLRGIICKRIGEMPLIYKAGLIVNTIIYMK